MKVRVVWGVAYYIRQGLSLLVRECEVSEG